VTYPFELAVALSPWINAGLTLRYFPAKAYRAVSPVVFGVRVDEERERYLRFNAAQRRAVGDALVRMPNQVGCDIAVWDPGADRTHLLGMSTFDLTWNLQEAIDSNPDGVDGRLGMALRRAAERRGVPASVYREQVAGDERRMYAVWFRLVWG